MCSLEFISRQPAKRTSKRQPIISIICMKSLAVWKEQERATAAEDANVKRGVCVHAARKKIEDALLVRKTTKKGTVDFEKKKIYKKQ